MKNLATFHEYFLYIVHSNKVVLFDAFVIICQTLFRIKKLQCVNYHLSLYIVRFGDLICLITYIFLIRNKVSHIITNASNYTTLLLRTIYRKYSWKVARFFNFLFAYRFSSCIQFLWVKHSYSLTQSGTQ